MDLSSVLFSFQGRVGRKTYWLFTLAVMVLAVIMAIVEVALELEGLSLLLLLPLMWPSFAVMAKRWHDRNKSAWWILVNFIPVIGPLWAFVEMGLLAGTPGDNRFGAPPA